jgi:hypothetical protein
MQNILIQTKAELDVSECTFKPYKISNDLSSKVPRNEPVHIRLVADHEKSKQNLQNRKKEMIRNEMKDVTFSPQINSSSEKIVRRKSFNSTSNATSIYERLNAEAEIIREHDRERELKRQQEELKNSTFCPFYNNKKSPNNTSLDKKQNLVEHTIIDNDSPEKPIDEEMLNEEISAFIKEQNITKNVPIINETPLIKNEEVIPHSSTLKNNKSKLRKPNSKKKI